MKFWAIAALLMLAGCSDGGAAWWQKDWTQRTPLTVDTTTTGVNLSGPIGRTPLLIRLHSGNFDFGASADNGSDIRIIAADNKTPLTYHIESYDPLLGVGTLWVDMPKLAGGEKAPIWLYHGNKAAPAAVNTGSTFDADTVLVLHYDEAVGTPIADKTAYKNNPANGPTSVDEGSIIGRGGKFAASTGMVVPASNSLATSGPFTFSTWVKIDAPGERQTLFARDGSGLDLVAGVPTMIIGGATAAAAAPIAAGQWTHVAVAADGKATRLYVNGQESAALPGAAPAATGAVTIGGSAGAPFTGGLDETRLSKVARPAAMLRADAIGQGPDSKLVAFGKDEEQGAGGGTVLFILKATPALDWAIIATCLLMLAAAIVVIVTKARYLNRSIRANAVFMKRFRQMHEDLIPITAVQGISAAELKFIDQAPLAHLYSVGLDEIEIRAKSMAGRPLTGTAVEALRAAVDAQQVEENQQLDKWMVLLTIAISGGPFIGLLGTVMGVMNTFGGVAMAGDVNVNAIAPGIAAALLATIAGLACAIPALFGYNYLNAQIGKLADDMRIFVDRLVTRLAETAENNAMPTPENWIAA